MRKLFATYCPQNHSHCSGGIGWIVVAMLLFFLPNTADACRLKPAGDGNGLMIHVTGHTFQGNYLIITYDIDFPGMTKVKLFNGNNEMLWRSQYVDDKVGEHKLIVKSSMLNPGNYVFEFDYKNQKQNYAISM